MSILWKNEKCRTFHEDFWMDIFRTVTSRHIHATYFILMCKKDFFFYMNVDRTKKKFITVVQLLSSLKQLILSFAGRKTVSEGLLIFLTHQSFASSGSFFLFSKPGAPFCQSEIEELSCENVLLPKHISIKK